MTRKTTRGRRARARSNTRIWIIAGLIVVAVVVAGGLILANQPSAATPPSTSVLTQCGQAACGQANAPVTIDEYSDFQ